MAFLGKFVCQQVDKLPLPCSRALNVASGYVRLTAWNKTETKPEQDRSRNLLKVLQYYLWLKITTSHLPSENLYI